MSPPLELIGFGLHQKEKCIGGEYPLAMRNDFKAIRTSLEFFQQAAPGTQ